MIQSHAIKGLFDLRINLYQKHPMSYFQKRDNPSILYLNITSITYIEPYSNT